MPEIGGVTESADRLAPLTCIRAFAVDCHAAARRAQIGLENFGQQAAKPVTPPHAEDVYRIFFTIQ